VKRVERRAGPAYWRYFIAFIFLGGVILYHGLEGCKQGDRWAWLMLVAGVASWAVATHSLIASSRARRKRTGDEDQFNMGEYVADRVADVVLGPDDMDWPEPVKPEYPKLGDIARNMSVGKVPAVIHMLRSRAKLQRKNALMTLCLYTGCDYGEDITAWRQWYEANRDRQPPDWWAGSLRAKGYETDGLALEEQIPVIMVCMMEEENQYVRYAAERLLSHLTGTKVLYSHDGSEKLRRWQLKKWKAGYEKMKRLREKRPGKGA
jgi:hypothetical protein